MYNVLIVEDDPMVSMINEQYVNRNPNFKVVAKFKDGNSAIEFLESNNADLIILDVFMPIKDGFETLRQIRKKKISVEVIMVTAANDTNSLEEALHLGVVDYLVKPFTYDRFSVALEKFIYQTDALKSVDTLTQKSIDYIIENTHKKSDTLYPKGIQENTLQIILSHLSVKEWLSGEEIAFQTGLTSVTVRRYMNHLTKSGKVICEMNYETGGRPCMLYRLTK